MSEKKDTKGILAKVKLALADLLKDEKFVDLKLSDGTTISVDKQEVGGNATKDGAPAGAGEYELEDKSKITVDASGVITAVTPAPAPVEEQKQSEELTLERVMKSFETLSERITRLESENAAQKNVVAAAEQSVKGSEVKLAKQEEIMKQMVELVEEMAGAATSETPGESKKKFSFSNVEGKKKSLEKYQAAALKIASDFAESKKTA